MATVPDHLYPPLEPYRTGDLSVPGGHSLYYEECGNPEGIPVAFVHGGPGAGAGVDDRRYFDPVKFRVILFDQRGCGHSRPEGRLENNTTADLVEDIERLRSYLDIDNWAVFGGSWGSTLALAYAEAHPARVTGLVVRGIWLNTKKDFDWAYRGGAARFYPQQWREFVVGLTAEHRRDPIHAYRDLMESPDPRVQLDAARRWATWESWLLSLNPNAETMSDYTADKHALDVARVETHYFTRDRYCRGDRILKDAGSLQGIPGVIVQGRYDMFCPPDNADALHRAWPGSELVLVEGAGHFGHDAVLEPELVKAMDALVLRELGVSKTLSIARTRDRFSQPI